MGSNDGENPFDRTAANHTSREALELQSSSVGSLDEDNDPRWQKLEFDDDTVSCDPISKVWFTWIEFDVRYHRVGVVGGTEQNVLGLLAQHDRGFRSLSTRVSTSCSSWSHPGVENRPLFHMATAAGRQARVA